MSRTVTLAAAGIVLAALQFYPASAAPGDGPDRNRYSMQAVEGGVVRLDNMTGEMALCHVEANRMACDMAADEKSALQARIDRLEKRIARLEEESGAAGPQDVPTDKDLDRAMNAFERVMRRLFKMVDDLNRDFRERPQPEGGSAAPQRT